MKRREYLGGIAGLGAIAATGTANADEGNNRSIESLSRSLTGDGHHPGPPRFVQVGDLLMDPIFTDAGHGFGRDNLAPSIPNPERDPENAAPGEYQWRITSRPEDSEAEIVYAPTPYEDDIEQYDSGQHDVAEFTADVPGTYVLELAAPDGVHELTIFARPAEPQGAGGPPRIDLDGHYDADTDEFVIESNARLAPDSNAGRADLELDVLPHDESGLAREDITIDGLTARVPRAALDGETELYAAAWDGEQHSMTDEIVLDPDGESVSLPNRPPDWMDEAVIYEIFTRSFAGGPGETDFAFLESKVDYLADLGVDVVWLTPIVPAWSAEVTAETGTNAPGGPHGYSTGDYFDVAEDLGTLEEYRAFIDACNDAGIKVCFDFVINHCGWTHPFFQDTIDETGPERENFWEFPRIEAWNEDSKHFDWFDRMAGASDYDAAPAFTSFFGVRLQPNLNYGNVAVREHILAAADFWVKEVGVDAFRCDIAWGVPHSFWKELRERVKSYDADFMLLDETIPNDPEFAESEFDAHFDTVDFMRTAKDVAAGNAAAEELIQAVEKRRREGFPDHTHIINSLENHDESRLYVDIEESGVRDDPANAQRAAAAATFALPGIPFIYYGQERLISEYGTDRESPFADIPHLSDDLKRNPYSRGFMNWAENGAEVPEDHLQFYRDLIDFYKTSPVLGQDAELVRAWYEADSDDVLVFGLDAGDEKRVVVINFGDDPATVGLRPAVDTVDQFASSDLGIEGDDGEDGRTTVDVETFAVLEAESLYGVGSQVVALADDIGDDHGPGGYTYPTADEYTAGEFDLTEFRVHESDDAIQFIVSFDAPLENPRGYEGGFSHQHLQFYLQDPDAVWGIMEGREGTNTRLAGHYQYRVVADGENGVRVETGERNSDLVATGDLRTTPADELVVAFPKTVLDRPISAHFIAPLVMGYDPDAPGNVMPVEADAGPHTFGGNGDENAPNVIDLTTPADTTQAEALEYGSMTARIPYTQLRTPFETVVEWDDATGDGHGPGNYALPESGDFYEGCYDIDRFVVEENRDRVRFVFQLPVPVENTWGLPRGFSHQFFQVYIRDPDATENAPTTTTARHGMHASFDQPYHYRVAVAGEGPARVERPDADATYGEVVSGDVVATVAGDQIMLDVPKHAIGGSLDGLELSPILAPYDGYGEGGLRGIAASTDEYVIGGGHDDPVDPKVMDLLVPEGTTQADALAYDTDTQPTIPFVPIDGAVAAISGQTQDGGSDSSDDETSETTTTTTTAPTTTTTTSTTTEASTPADGGTTAAESPGFGVLTGLAALGIGAYRMLGKPDDE